MTTAVREPVGEIVSLELDSETLAFAWGHPHELGTTAYWVEQTRRRPPVESFRIGETFEQEVVACILGGYGIPAAVGLAAFDAIRDAGLFERGADLDQIQQVLGGPIFVPSRQRSVNYRFARQRSERVVAALDRMRNETPPEDEREMRNWLMTLPGVGPKTASWVVRNWTGSESVAIIDIHLHRAGVAAGFFSPEWMLPRDYKVFDEAFCALSEFVDVSLAALDACIWDQMQYLGAHQSVMLERPAHNVGQPQQMSL